MLLSLRRPSVIYRPAVSRRRNYADPMCGWATLCRRLAYIAAAISIFGVLCLRNGWFDLSSGLGILAGGLGVHVLALLAGGVACVIIWNRGERGFARVLMGMILSLSFLIGPVVMGVRYATLPNIHDITTDFSDPPQLVMAQRLRAADAHPTTYPGAVVAAQQIAAYPDVTPVEVALPIADTFKIIERIIAKKGWRVLDIRSPSPHVTEARIEAVAPTLVLGLRDDVVIRLRADRKMTRVDMRSASRYGTHDLGHNAARITSFMESVEQAVQKLK